MSEKNIRRGSGQRGTLSDVPFLAPTTRGGGEYTWVLDAGVSITYLASDHVSLFQGGIESAVLDPEDARSLGERVYADAKTDSEKRWGRALCSAASIPKRASD